MLNELDLTRPFVLLEDNHGGVSQLFTDLARQITASEPAEVPSALLAVRAALADGVHAAGWMGFEAGYALEPSLPQPQSGELLWFGLFRDRRHFTPLEMEQFWQAPVASPQAACVTSILPSWSEETYTRRAARVHDYILSGDIYQANLTFPLDVKFEGGVLTLYRQLRRAQGAPYGAIVFTGERWILSFSPELFFSLQADVMRAQPMKGTALRACVPLLDDAQAAQLQQDSKNRAENLMIVDLLRNDLARVSVPGSVKVPDLFRIVSFPTVHQMVSSVEAQKAPGKDAVDVLTALFPCGSVTGAPKLRAMQIIRDLEDAPRGVYCGAIGHMEPQGSASFNVAIRTLEIAGPGTARLGVGSGIVADSMAAAEYAECLLKAQFLTRLVPPFDLIETMAWHPGSGWLHWEQHMSRLRRSAACWHFALDEARIAADAARLAKGWTAPMRVRLVASRFGNLSWQWRGLTGWPATLPNVAVSPLRQHSDNVFLYHKTSHRAFYDEARQRLQQATGCDECLFLNERDEMTEGSFTSLFVRKGHVLLTPPVISGVLPGVLRQSLLDSGQAREAILTEEDVRHADELLIGNSVRGLTPVNLLLV